MKRILLSLGMLVFIGGLVAGATGAFFSDTETSTGNTFAAGDIDLQIDNESYALDFNIPGFPEPVGNLVFNPATSWDMANLTNQRFFNFTDVKPGDYGEDTISIHVGSNDAWMCAAARITDDSDQTCTEPELADDPTCVPTATDGELDSALNFAFWVDDGDNVYEPVAGQSGSPEGFFLKGPLSALDDAGKIALADTSVDTEFVDPVPGDSTFYIAKIWCAGELEDTDLVQDGSATTTNPTLGTGWTCNGAAVNNAAQTDRVIGDMQFYATQARNNDTFTCEANYTPVWPTLPLVTAQ